LSHALDIIEKEKAIALLRTKISKEVEKKVQESHRKYLLMEQVCF